MQSLRALLRFLFPKPTTPQPVARPTFLDVVTHKLRGYTPLSAFVRNADGCCAHGVPQRMNGREVPWRKLSPHLEFPYENCTQEQLFPSLRIFTAEGRDVLIGWDEEQGRFMCTTLESSKSRPAPPAGP